MSQKMKGETEGVIIARVIPSAHKGVNSD
jgi:hypothetical protein